MELWLQVRCLLLQVVLLNVCLYCLYNEPLLLFCFLGQKKFRPREFRKIFLLKPKVSAMKMSLLSLTFFINMLFYNFAAPMICYCLGLLVSYIFGWVLTYRYIIWANIAFCILYMGLMMTVKESPVFLMRKKKEEVGIY